MVEKNEKLQAFAMEMKQGYTFVKEGKNEEAIKKLRPFVELMRTSGAPNIRLFVSYSIAQIRTGDIEGFLQTYAEIKEMDPKNTDEQSLKNQIDGFFTDLMDELQKNEDE